MFFVPKGPIDIKEALVQVMSWHQTEHKPLSAPMSALFSLSELALGYVC